MWQWETPGIIAIRNQQSTWLPGTFWSQYSICGCVVTLIRMRCGRTVTNLVNGCPCGTGRMCFIDLRHGRLHTGARRAVRCIMDNQCWSPTKRPPSNEECPKVTFCDFMAVYHRGKCCEALDSAMGAWWRIPQTPKLPGVRLRGVTAQEPTGREEGRLHIAAADTTPPWQGEHLTPLLVYGGGRKELQMGTYLGRYCFRFDIAN